MTKDRIENESLFQNPALVPFVWNFIVNMFLIILFANIDVRNNLSINFVPDHFKSSQHQYRILLGVCIIGNRLPIWKAILWRQVDDMDRRFA
jgi:hypothetical protein